MDQTYKQQRARRYLEALGGMREHLNALRESEAQAWEIATSTTPKPTKDAAILGTTIDRTNTTNRAAENYAKLSEDIRTIEAEIQEAYRERINTINKLDNHGDAAILINHYVNGWTWERTAETIGYSPGHVQHRAAAALTKIYDLMPVNKR